MGCLHPTEPRCFQRAPSLQPVAVPRYFRNGFILSRALPLLQSSPVRTRPSPPGAEHLPWGFVPFATSAAGVHVRGHPEPAPFRPHGFSPPRRLAPPLASRTQLRPLPLMGFSAPESPFGRVGRDALRHPLHPFVRGAFHPRTLRNSRSEAPRPRGHLSPPALVPRPRFQDSRASPSEHLIPGPS